jgi:peptidyl-dipeptidase Dcp
MGAGSHAADKDVSMPSADAQTNPLANWTGPYGGVPPFDQVTPAGLGPALEAAMAAELAAVDAIAENAEPATFDNTIAALERAGTALERVGTIYSVFTSNLADDAVQAVEREMSPKLAAHGDRIIQNGPLFARVKAVYDSRESAGLTAEQQRLTWLTYTSFVRQGAALDATSKRTLAEINGTLATLTTDFAQHVLADENDRFVLVDDQSRLAGLPESLVAAAAAEATRRGKTGWALANTRSVVEPVLTVADNRQLREEVWRMFVSRGAEDGPTNTLGIIREVVALRAERAHLLGYATHAHWQLEHAMARTPERAMALMEEVWTPAVATVASEVAAMQAVADAEAAALKIEPWDYRYYAEKVRLRDYDLDEAEIVPYLQLEKLREGMFHVAATLFDLHFSPLDSGPVEQGGVPVFHPDVRVWGVHRGSGEHVGLWYFDPFARPGKRSGAWMSGYRAQASCDEGSTAIVSNNCNFTKPPAGEAVTISWTDAETLFHEFGHALHGLSSKVTYSSLSGTRVPRDYVEFPSQVLEHWLSTPEILETYALHVETGEPIPKDLVAKIERASAFNVGFGTVEFLASALVDMKLHLAEPPADIAVFERETLAAIGMPQAVGVMRHRLPHFLHLFTGDAYSAAYYSYLWADVLTADAWEAFTEAEGPWDAEVAGRLVGQVFSAGNTVDAAEAYRGFRGRDPDTKALMRKRGFAAAGE